MYAIRSYYEEHNPAHIHVYYQESSAVFNVFDCEMEEGSLPTKQQRLVIAWMEIHKEELLADWELCQNGEKPFKIDPLK